MPSGSSAADGPPKHVVLLYRKATESSPGRLDKTVQAVTLALEHELLNRQYQITEPSPEVYRAMDQGPGVIVTFAPDAGLSIVYSVDTSMRPEPGTDIAIAEVRIEARVFLGSTLLSAEAGRGQIQTRVDPALKSYGETRGYEIAAQRAAVDVVNQVNKRLAAISAEEFDRLVAEDKTDTAGISLVAPPGAPVADGPPASVGAAAGTTVPPVIGKRWLVTVGVADFSRATGFAGAGTHANDLPGTPTDVKNVRRALKSLGFDDSEVNQLFDRTATTAGVRAALDRLATSVGSDDLAVLYVSTHGMEEDFGKTGMTMPVFFDSNVAADPGGQLDFATLVRQFSRVPARQLIMLIDACHSGGAAAQMTTVSIRARSVEVTRSGGSPDVARVMAAAKGLHSDIAVMSAARTDESALDLGPLVGGLFTSSLIKALVATKGIAPLEDVYTNYVWSPVIDYCKKSGAGDSQCQHPVLAYAGAGNLIRFGPASP